MYKFTKIDCDESSLYFLNKSRKNISEKASVDIAKIIRHMIGFEETNVDLRLLVKDLYFNELYSHFEPRSRYNLAVICLSN